MDLRKCAVWGLGLVFASAGCQAFDSGKSILSTKGPDSPPVKTEAEIKPQVAAKPNGKSRSPSANLLSAMAFAKEGEINPKTMPAETQMRMRDEVRQIYQDALRTDPNHVGSLRGLARTYTLLEHYDKAQEVYQKAVAKHPREAILWLEYGQCLNRQKNFAGAAQKFEKALEVDPENRNAIQALGFTLARAGQTDKAVGLLTRSMGSTSAHYNVARMLLHLQQEDLAKAYLRRAVEETPNFEPAQTLLASLSTPNGAAAARAHLDVSFTGTPAAE